MATIQEVYIALFGRPADPIGYNFYVDATDDGANLDAVGDLSASAEYQDRFTGMSDIDRVNQIFQDLFGRPADAAGLIFYTQLLQNGGASAQDIAIRILDGATGTDAQVIENKVEAAQLFTDSLDTAEEITAYQGEAAADFGRAFLSGVTADAATVPNQAAVDAQLATLVSDNPGQIGDTFTLTTGLDNFAGTNFNDTFQAVQGLAADTTINTFDNINGGAGRDTLNIVGAGGTAINANATIRGIEVVNVATTGAVTNLNSASFQGVEQLWQVGANGAVTVGAGVTAGFRNSTALNTVTVADGVKSAAVALDNVATAGTVTFAETTAGDLTAVSVSGNVADAGALTVNTAASTTAVDTVNLALSSDGAVTVTADATVLTTVDASESTGNLGLNLGATYLALESITGGSGNDTVTFATAAGTTAEAVTIDLGAGNDVLNFDAANATGDVAVSITLGAGNDTLAIDSLANISDDADVTNDLIIVTDFNADQDVLDLSGLNGVLNTLNNTEIANISAAASLDAALDLVASYVDTDTAGAEDFAIFNYGGNAYVYVSNTLATTVFTDGDGLIQLTGVNANDLDAQSLLV